MFLNGKSACSNKKLKIPSPQTGKALLDTGANTTRIDLGAIARLQLPFWKTDTILTVQGPTQERWYKGVMIEFPRAKLPPVRLDVVGAVNGLDADGLIAVFGRDVLSHFVFTYDGITGTLKLSAPDSAQDARLRAV